MTVVVQGEVARGKLVVLRRKRREDAPADYAWRKDPELVRYDAAKPITSSLADFQALWDDELVNPSPFRCAFAVEDGEGRHIGNVMYYNIDRLKGEAEVGITIGDRGYWGRGYGTDALKTLTRYLFATTNLDRLRLKTLDWNLRAQRSFEKAGFVACGKSRRSDGSFCLMELRREWVAAEEGDG
jgi:[ribosomal protein S5]-alanine N-acetyltransferase